jgi:hypothetical protein
MQQLTLLKCITFSFVFLVLTFSCHPLLYDVFATKSPFSRVIVGHSSDNWTLKHFPSSLGFIHKLTSNGTNLYFDRAPISRTECKINPYNNEYVFPSPGIASISYSSDGKILNTTIWLDHPYTPTINNSSLSHSLLNDVNISQAGYFASVMLAENKTLNEAVANHIRLYNHTMIHLYSNESGPWTIKGNAAYRVVYTYRGGSNDPCSICKEMDLLSMKDEKLYLLSYFGDVKKYSELLPNIKNMINSTNLGFQKYKNSTLGIEIQYPNDWSRGENLGTVGFFSRLENNTDRFPEGVAITINPPKIPHNLSLAQETKSLIEFHKRSGLDFHLIGNQPTMIEDKLSQRLIYTQSGPNGGSMKVLEIVLLKDGKLYLIRYLADVSRYSIYLPAVEQMINSFRVIGQSEGLIKSQKQLAYGNSNFSTYENSTYRIRMSYPINRSLPFLLPLEKNFFQATQPRYNDIVTFSPSIYRKDQHPPLLTLYIDNSPGENNSPGEKLTLHNYLDKVTNIFKNLPNFKLIKSTTNATLADNRAYTLDFSYHDNGTVIRQREFGTIIGDDKVMRVRYFSTPTNFEKYLPVAKTMMDSLKINIPTLDYKSSYFTLEYPYNWAKKEGATHSMYKDRIIASSGFFSPVKGPYYFAKNYRLDIDYDYPYKELGKGMPYTIEYSASSTNPTWSKLISEWSLDGKIKKLLYNVTQSKGFIEEEKGYVTLPVDLGSLNLPNQFYMTVGTEETFLKDGQYCFLNDRTDLVSSPPPEYSILLSPASLTNMRPGDEKNVEVQVKSNSTLPFDLTLAGLEKDLELTFNPNKTAGVPGGITTSNLHIKVQPNATVEKQHTFPIDANIHLRPTFNPTNASVANITKISDFTITISPPLTIQQQISEAWNGFGSALNGFIGLMAAIIGVSGIIGGFFLRKLKKEKDDDKTQRL